MKLPDISRLQFDHKKHAYTLDRKLLQGVTSIIDGTSSKANLIDWAARMACENIHDKWQSYHADIEGFYNDLPLLLEEAKSAHTRRKEAAGTKGTDTHALVENYILDCINHFDGKPGQWPDRSIESFVEWSIANVDRFIAAEQRLYSENHKFAGTCDFVAIIDGKLTIGDLKTFPKMWSADAFIQMGAYSLAWTELTGERPEQSVVVKMCDPEDERLKKYGGKAFAVYPRYALAEDEEMFLTRLKMYRYNQAFVSPKE